MSKSSDRVKKWREETKKKLVKCFRGACSICGYNKCFNALQFHHIDPDKKEFTIGKILARPKAWHKIIQQLKKCVCLCSNCHRQLHAGLFSIQLTDKNKLDENLCLEYSKKWENVDACPVCGKLKPIKNIFCSLACSGKSKRRVNWDNVDLKNLLASGMSFVAIGEQLNVSDNSVRKRAKKLGLI